jgi:hypothetical protein
MRNFNEPHDRDQNAAPVDRPVAADPDWAAADCLIPEKEVEQLRQQWTTVQSRFVDEPRKSVEEADHLVAAAIKQIEDGFTAGRSNLEKQWTQGEQVSTEDLRICLQHYRQFFDRLLSRVA